MIVLPELTTVTAFLFPEDRVVGKDALLQYAEEGVERWWRCYAFTMPALAEAIIAANKNAPQHVALDHSQTAENREQKTLALDLIEAGVETTVLTSPEGADYIAHSKAWADADGRCWHGSLNFSESAWRQVNTAETFVSPQWRDALVAQFKVDVAWAWANEPRLQLAPSPPSWLPAHLAAPTGVRA